MRELPADRHAAPVEPTDHRWPVRTTRDAAQGSGSSFAIWASYSEARSNSLLWVKESACFARRRQRSACSFKVDKSIAITHRITRKKLTLLQWLYRSIVSARLSARRRAGSIRFLHGPLPSVPFPHALSRGREGHHADVSGLLN